MMYSSSWGVNTLFVGIAIAPSLQIANNENKIDPPNYLVKDDENNNVAEIKSKSGSRTSKDKNMLKRQKSFSKTQNKNKIFKERVLNILDEVYSVPSLGKIKNYYNKKNNSKECVFDPVIKQYFTVKQITDNKKSTENEEKLESKKIETNKNYLSKDVTSKNSIRLSSKLNNKISTSNTRSSNVNLTMKNSDSKVTDSSKFSLNDICPDIIFNIFNRLLCLLCPCF